MYIHIQYLLPKSKIIIILSMAFQHLLFILHFIYTRLHSGNVQLAAGTNQYCWNNIYT